MNEVGFGDAEFDQKSVIYLNKLKKSKILCAPVFSTVQGEAPCSLEELKGREGCLCGRWLEDTPLVMPCGPTNSKIVFVSNEPSFEDIESGKMFTKEDADGTEYANGIMFDWYLENLGLTREEVYVTNALMCKAFGNYYFDSSNMIECSKFKKKEFENLKDVQYIFTLGTVAFQLMSGIFGSASDYYGSYFVWNREDKECFVIPLPHPSNLNFDTPIGAKIKKLVDAIRFGQ